VIRPVLLDTSFLIALEREVATREQGPARRFLPSLRGRPLVVSIVSVEELRFDGTPRELRLSLIEFWPRSD
jgi:hypothetical protein